MSYRVNMMLENNAWQALQGVSKGERSKVVSLAILEWFKSQRRKQAVQQMDALKGQIPSISAKKIVSLLRKDRKRTKK